MKEIEAFEIRTDVIYHYYNNGYFVPGTPIDVAMNKFVGNFLADAGLASETPDLYKSFIARHKFGKDLEDKLPDKDQWLNESFLTYNCCREMVRQMERWPDITHASDIKLKYQVFNRNIYYFFELEFPISPVRGVILNQRVLVDRVKYPSVYRRLFAYIYSKCETPLEFIQYHLEKSFDSNHIEYKIFLYSVERDNMDLISTGKNLWNECINQLLITRNSKKLSQKLTHREEILKFHFEKEMFNSVYPLTKDLRKIEQRYKAHLSLSRGRNYRPPQLGELENVIRSIKNSKPQLIFKDFEKISFIKSLSIEEQEYLIGLFQS